MELSLILEIAIAALLLVSIFVVIKKKRKSGEEGIPWDLIRPILIESLIRVQKLQEAKKLGYQALEDYAVTLILSEINDTIYLRENEKKLITKEIVRSIVAPRLKEINQRALEKKK